MIDTYEQWVHCIRLLNDLEPEWQNSERGQRVTHQIAKHLGHTLTGPVASECLSLINASWVDTSLGERLVDDASDRDVHTDTRVDALAAIGNTQNPRFLPTLRALLGNPNEAPRILAQAARSLGKPTQNKMY